MKNTGLSIGELKMKNTGLSIVGAITLIVLAMFIAPFICFWAAYFSGWIAKITIGSWLVNGLSLIGINISIDKIPLLAGILGWIGSFFKNFITSNKNN